MRELTVFAMGLLDSDPTMIYRVLLRLTGTASPTKYFSYYQAEAGQVQRGECGTMASCSQAWR
jgi:hypothetical protein